MDKKPVDFEIELKGGKVEIVVKHDGSDADVELKLVVEAARLLDKLAEKIPGEIDDAVIAMLKAAFLKA